MNAALKPDFRIGLQEPHQPAGVDQRVAPSPATAGSALVTWLEAANMASLRM